MNRFGLKGDDVPQSYKVARKAALEAARAVSPVPHDEAVLSIADAASDTWREDTARIIIDFAVRDADHREELRRFKDLLREACRAYVNDLDNEELSQEVLDNILTIIGPALLNEDT